MVLCTLTQLQDTVYGILSRNSNGIGVNQSISHADKTKCANTEEQWRHALTHRTFDYTWKVALADCMKRVNYGCNTADWIVNCLVQCLLLVT